MLPQDRTDTQTGVMLAPPQTMHLPSLPLPPQSPEPHPMPRPCAEYDDEDEIGAAKRAAALELPGAEECPLCLEARLRWCGCARMTC